jgi:3-deoxy-D-manno-octulosonate 8-phosphate phosphatase (KDO 8-P phosphatase)
MNDYRTIHDRCRGIDLVVIDVDGVLTDGRLIYTERGEEAKAFHVRDGSGIKRWLQLGKRAALLTGRSSPIVERRGKELGISAIVQSAEDKLPAFERLLAGQRVSAEHTAYIGDDWPDVPVLRSCGLAVAVADACDEVHAAAHYVTQAPGGHGAVRELIDLLLRHQQALTRAA